MPRGGVLFGVLVVEGPAAELIPTSVVVGAAAAAASGGARSARSSALGASVGGLTQVHAASATMTTTVRTSRAPVRRPGAAMQRS